MFKPYLQRYVLYIFYLFVLFFFFRMPSNMICQSSSFSVPSNICFPSSETDLQWIWGTNVPLSIGFEHFVGKQINKQNYVQVHLEQSLGDIEFEIRVSLIVTFFLSLWWLKKKKSVSPSSIPKPKKLYSNYFLFHSDLYFTWCQLFIQVEKLWTYTI